MRFAVCRSIEHLGGALRRLPWRHRERQHLIRSTPNTREASGAHPLDMTRPPNPCVQLTRYSPCLPAENPDRRLYRSHFGPPQPDRFSGLDYSEGLLSRIVVLASITAWTLSCADGPWPPQRSYKRPRGLSDTHRNCQGFRQPLEALLTMADERRGATGVSMRRGAAHHPGSSLYVAEELGLDLTNTVYPWTRRPSLCACRSFRGAHLAAARCRPAWNTSGRISDGKLPSSGTRCSTCGATFRRVRISAVVDRGCRSPPLWAPGAFFARDAKSNIDSSRLFGADGSRPASWTRPRPAGFYTRGPELLVIRFKDESGKAGLQPNDASGVDLSLSRGGTLLHVDQAASSDQAVYGTRRTWSRRGSVAVSLRSIVKKRLDLDASLYRQILGDPLRENAPYKAPTDENRATLANNQGAIFNRTLVNGQVCRLRIDDIAAWLMGQMG